LGEFKIFIENIENQIISIVLTAREKLEMTRQFESQSLTNSYFLRRGIGIGAQSTLGGKTFLPENMHEKLTKCPNFTRDLPEKLTKFPNFT